MEGERTVRLNILKGINLAKKDIFGASDPYVKVSIISFSDGDDDDDDNGEELICTVAQTRTKKRTLNPVWNEEFIFNVATGKQIIHLEVFDENRLTRDDFLGLVQIRTDCIQEAHSDMPPKDYLLRPRSARSRVKGHLRLIIGFVSTVNLNSDVDSVLDMASNFVIVSPVGESTDENSSINQSVCEMEMSNSQGEQLNSVTNGPSEDVDTGPVASSETSNADVLIEGETTDGGITVASEAASSAATSSEESLPSGWEARVDSLGRTFYIDHLNLRTQWERPSRTNSLDLPSGWEERQDYNGRTYYVNHATRVTQWQRPSSQTDTSTDDETERLHSIELANMYRNRRHVSQEDTIEAQTRSTSLPSIKTTPPSPEIVIEPLPAGWAEAQTPGGRTFFINHNNRTTTWLDPRRTPTPAEEPKLAPTSPVPRASSNEDLLKDLGPLPAGWEERVHVDGRIFYVNHMTRVTQWEDPRLDKFGGPAVPYSRDYKQKYDYFRSKLRKPSNVPNKIDIKVRRSRLLEDSFNVISGVKKPDLLKARLWIEFDGETGLDYGGVAREWFYLLSREMFNPYYGLFEYSAIDDYCLQINPNSGLANELHIQYFKFIGRVAGMAVYHGKLLDGFFIRPFYKMMLGKPITLCDMEAVDSEYYNSLVWILENDPDCLCLTFSVDEEYFGETVERELIPDGKNMAVTDQNKHQYIDLVIKWRFIERIKKQMIAFMDGFNDLISHDLLQIFDENELELLMCGLQDIDVKDWKNNTVFKGEYNPNHPVIVNFWRACYSFNNEMRSRLLQFVTGTSRVPMNGFRELQGSNGPQLFTIEKWGKPDMLPRTHTCFNRLDLPPYPTYEELRRRLLTAVENSGGFEGVD